MSVDVTHHSTMICLICSLWQSPDFSSGVIGVLSCHNADVCAGWRVLIDIHDVIIHRKDWSFVHVPDDDLQRGGVFERAEVRETRVQVCIRSLDA